MQKISEKYKDEETGITFKVFWEDEGVGVKFFNGVPIELENSIKVKKIRLNGSNLKTEFVFNKSKAETIKKVGEAFVRIADFCEGL